MAPSQMCDMDVARFQTLLLSCQHFPKRTKSVCVCVFVCFGVLLSVLFRFSVFRIDFRKFGQAALTPHVKQEKVVLMVLSEAYCQTVICAMIDEPEKRQKGVKIHPAGGTLVVVFFTDTDNF